MNENINIVSTVMIALALIWRL